MTGHKRLLVVVMMAALSVLAACGPASTATPEASIPLEGTKWVLSSLRGDAPVAGTSLTLGFYPDNYMEGTAGCNSYGVDYAASGREFRIAEVHRTDFACDEPAGVMPQDGAFFEALASVAAYRASEDRLEFDNAAGETILVYTRQLPAAVDPALQNTEWLLTSLRGASPLAGSRITLNLSGEGFGGVSGCNNYGGEYKVAEGGELEFGSIAVTLMACSTPEGIMEQEQAYGEALGQVRAYVLAGGRLELQDATGETILVFAKKDQFSTDPGALLGTAWRLVSVDGEDVQGATFTLTFYSETILGGHAGCRDYLAAYQVDGDNLNLIFEAMFDADCRVEDADLGQEGQFLDVLSPKADLGLDEGQLAIHGERGGVLLFEPLPEEASLDLEGPTWSLLAFVGPNPYVEEPEPWPMPVGLLAGTAIDLTLEGNAAQGSAGCNDYGSAYTHSGASLSFEAIASTKMACLDPAGIMEQESKYTGLLAAATGYRIYGDRLWLDTADGQALVFFATER